MKILFCMASGQPAANINSIGEVSPDLAVIATTKIMQDNANSLMAHFHSVGVKAHILMIDNESSLKALNEQYEQWLENHFDDDIVVNITGGTKLMSIAAYSIFGSYGFRCFYQDNESKHIIWLDNESIVSNIGHKLPLMLYLQSYQFTIDNKIELNQIPKVYKDFSRLLHEKLSLPSQYEDVARLITKINAQTAKHKSNQDKISRFSFDVHEQKILAQLRDEFGLFDINGSMLTNFENDRAFLNGGWLEVLVTDYLRGTDFRDICQSVEISKSTQRQNTQTRQEIDVMAMKKDKLYIFECKTVKWKKASDASEAIYKLRALGDIGGLNTQPVFVSLYDLPSAAKTRAAEMGIYLICGQGINQLKSQLRTLE